MPQCITTSSLILSLNAQTQNSCKFKHQRSNTVLVDNNCNSFALQKSNGIPISSFYDDASDVALTKLMKFLKYLTKVQDVRPRLKALFNVCEVPRRAIRRKSLVEKKTNHFKSSSEKENIPEDNTALSTTSV